MLYISDGHSTLNKIQNNSDGLVSTLRTDEKIIAGRTKKLFTDLDNNTEKIETELFKAAMKIMGDPDLPSLVILIGKGSGTNYAAKMLFHTLASDAPESIRVYLRHQSEFRNLESDEETIALIHNSTSNGSSNNTAEFLDMCYEVIQDCVSFGTTSSNKIRFIVAIGVCKEIKDHKLFVTYRANIVDAREQKYRPSLDEIKELTRSICNQNDVSIGPAGMSGKIESPNSLKSVGKDVIDTIPSLVGRIGHIEKLNKFFQYHLAEGIEYFRKPDPQVVNQFRRDLQENPLRFLAMLAVYAHRGKLGVGRLDQMTRINSHLKQFWQSVLNIKNINKSKIDEFGTQLVSTFPEGVMMFNFAQKHNYLSNIATYIQTAARCMDGMYLDRNGNMYQFLNESVLYSFLVVLCEEYPVAIETCPSDFFFNYILPHDDPRMADECLHVMKSKEMKKSLMKRFKTEFMMRQVAKCMRHPVMCPDFFREFLQYLGKTPHLTWEVLRQQNIDPKHPYTCIVFGLENNCSRVGSVGNNTDEIIANGKWTKKRKDPKLKEFTSIHEKEALEKAVEYQIESTFKSLVQMGAKIPPGALMKALDVQNEIIIDFILKKASFAEDDWYNIVIHVLEILSFDTYHESFLRQTEHLISKASVTVLRLLLHAVRTNNLKMVKVIYESSSLLDKFMNHESDTRAALKEAAQFGFAAICEYLSCRLCDNDMKTVGYLPWTEACLSGQSDTIDVFLQRNPCALHNQDGASVLFSAADSGNVQIVEYLMMKYDELMVNSTDETSKKSILTENDNEVGARCSICEGLFSANPLRVTNEEGRTALHIAAVKGHTLLIQYLIKMGMDLTSEDNFGETPLSLACLTKQKDVIDTVVKYFLQCDSPTNQRVVASLVQADEITVLRQLVDRGLRVDIASAEFRVPIIVATELKLISMMEFLLENGADPNITQDGWSPIHLTALNGDIRGLLILLQFGANLLTLQGNIKNTILHIAAEKVHMDYVKVALDPEKMETLAEEGDQPVKRLVDQKNVHWDTALHIAAKSGCAALIDMMLRYGFNSKLPNKSGMLPIDIIRNKHTEAIMAKDKKALNNFADCIELLCHKHELQD